MIGNPYPAEAGYSNDIRAAVETFRRSTCRPEEIRFPLAELSALGLCPATVESVQLIESPQLVKSFQLVKGLQSLSRGQLIRVDLSEALRCRPG